MEGINLLGLSSVSPKKTVTTTEMVSALRERLSDELADTMTHLGVEKRYTAVVDYSNYIAGKLPRVLETSTTKMAVDAVNKCLDNSAIDPKRIGLFIAVTNTADRPLPCLVYEVAAQLDQKIPRNASMVNMQNQGCSAFLKAVELARFFLAEHPEQQALIVISESHTAIFGPPKDRPKYYGFHEAHTLGLSAQELNATEKLIEACLFGDGASAFVFGKEKGIATFGAINHLTNLESSDTDILYMNEGGALYPTYDGLPAYRMSPVVPRRGALYVHEAVKEHLAKYPHDFLANDFYFIHTGSKKILQGICKVLNLEEQAHKTVESYHVLNDYGNLSSCSIPFMLINAIANGQKGKGFILSFGVGFSVSVGAIELH